MAKKQDILLVKDVLKLGNMGDIIKVAPGFARNYLLPERLGIPASLAQRRQVEVLRERAAKSETEREAAAITLKKSVDGMTLQIGARVAHDLELFGSIGTKEIVAALAKKGITVDTKQVHLTDKIRKLGVYPIEVRLHRSVSADIKLEIVNSDPNALSLADTLAAMAASKAARKSKSAAAAEGEGEEAAEGAKDEKAAKPAKAEKAGKGEKSDKNKAEKPAKADKASGKGDKAAGKSKDKTDKKKG